MQQEMLNSTLLTDWLIATPLIDWLIETASRDRLELSIDWLIDWSKRTLKKSVNSLSIVGSNNWPAFIPKCVWQVSRNRRIFFPHKNCENKQDTCWKIEITQDATRNLREMVPTSEVWALAILFGSRQCGLSTWSSWHSSAPSCRVRARSINSAFGQVERWSPGRTWHFTSHFTQSFHKVPSDSTMMKKVSHCKRLRDVQKQRGKKIPWNIHCRVKRRK